MPERSCVCTLCSTREIISVISRKLPESIAAKGANRRWKLRSLKFALSVVATVGRVRHSCTFEDNKELELISRRIKSEENLRRRESICGRTDAEQMEIKIRAADKRAETNERAHPRPLATGNRVRNKYRRNCEIKSDTASDGRPSHLHRRFRACPRPAPALVSISRKDFNGLR